jgi:serine/threonine protein phosphatase PrpC
VSFIKRNHQFFAWAQQIGASTPHESQQDRVRIEYVRTMERKKVLLAIIADGEHHPNAGDTAEHILNHIFNQFKTHRGGDFNQKLAHAFMSAGNYIQGKDGQVAATAIAIYRNRLYFAHSGHTTGFLIRGGKMIPLTRPTPKLLSMPSIEIQQGDAGGVRLQPGDHIMLATDGLLRTSPEDGRPFVNPEDIPAHIEGNSPDDASRHLVSLAMGRDVDDNVTVAVLQVSGEERRSPSPWKWLALLGAAALIFALVRLIPSVQDDEPTPTLIDYGYAVLIEGSANVETEDGGSRPAQRLEAVAPLSRILIQEVSRFALQSNIDTSTHLSNASIYLSSGSRVVLSLIDAGINLPEGLKHLSNRSKIGLDSGEILILRTAGSWVYQVDLTHVSVSLTGSGRGGIGIAASPSGTEVSCLLGRCEAKSDKDASIVLQAGQSILVLDGSLGEKESTSTETITKWNTLCGNCLDE